MSLLTNKKQCEITYELSLLVVAVIESVDLTPDFAELHDVQHRYRSRLQTVRPNNMRSLKYDFNYH